MRHPIRRIVLLLVAWALAAPISVPAAASATAGPPVQRFGVRLVDVPVSEAHNPRGLRYIIDYLPTGTTIHRRILVRNQEPRTVRFTVYPDAATIGRGSFIGDPGATRSELTTWISVKHPVLILGPHASALDRVTIRVPRGATRGEHYGVIWAQHVAHVRTRDGFGITQIARVGIRIYLAVGRGGAPPTKFAVTSITGHRSARGQPYVLAHVRDTGGRAVDLNGTARLSGGPGGTSAGPFRARRIITLAPGESGNVAFAPGRRLPDGPWRARITVVSGLTKATAAATIQFRSNRPAIWTRVAGVAAVAVGGVGLLTLALTRVRRRAARARHASA